MNYVKNNSSLQEYKNFQEFLSKDNAGSPIAFFGRDFQEIVNVELVEFPKKEQNSLIDKAKYFIETGVPDNANIRYSVTTKINSKIVSTEKYVAKMNFKFSGVKPSSEVVDPKLNFTITSYKIYKVK
jgi:type IV secretory pathway component VirB8